MPYRKITQDYDLTKWVHEGRVHTVTFFSKAVDQSSRTYCAHFYWMGELYWSHTFQFPYRRACIALYIYYFTMTLKRNMSVADAPK